MEEQAGQPFELVILVGALSGVIGAIIGPIIQRTFARNDKALEARQSWAKQKLQFVFGTGDEKSPSDGPLHPFMRLIPPNVYILHAYDMHSINWAVEESIDLMMLQPKRSSWAREWLYNWHFVMQQNAQVLHDKMHENRHDGMYVDETWERESTRYERRVNKLQSDLSIWATGQWLSHPSWRFWLANRAIIVERRRRNSIGARSMNARGPTWKSYCDCQAEYGMPQ
jgi:hypothetical protein